ncbi:hypothetical protein HGRIS_011372 [Hohenbuehelia grisea]|uniref:Uncharacterized protein n=1 Tax=Hohenbuehelia grisea TaxID=104357 RepID=A0ABR3JUX3_9AGAR
MACEGDCIRDITNAFLGNYTTPIKKIITEINHEILSNIPLSASTERTDYYYVSPILEDFDLDAYKILVNSLFRENFHGKCLDSNGVQPAGCPNPDCAIICGTPGSMVHFYPKVVQIVFDSLRDHLAGLVAPGTDTRKRMEKMILADAQEPRRKRRELHIRGRTIFAEPNFDYTESKFSENGHDGGHGLYSRANQPSKDATLARLSRMLEPAVTKKRMEKACGEQLSSCSWEASMKEYILSYP